MLKCFHAGTAVARSTWTRLEDIESLVEPLSGLDFQLEMCTSCKGAFTTKAKLFFASPKTREFTRSTVFNHERRDAARGAGLISVSRLREDRYHLLLPP